MKAPTPTISRDFSALAPQMEAIYRKYHHRQYVYPDPLAALYGVEDPRDQEVVGLIAAALAFGNVKTILGSIEKVLREFPHPGRMLPEMARRELVRRCRGFRHRYVGERELAALLLGIQAVLRAHGGLGACFQARLDAEDATVLPALTAWVAEIQAASGLTQNYLLPDPARGSACKRLLMYLRWMVRHDVIDLGLWSKVGMRRLLIPMDTHMHRLALGIGLTQRKQADLRAAQEVTAALATIDPADPTRFDFSLTRLGIRRDSDLPDFLERCRVALGTNAAAAAKQHCDASRRLTTPAAIPGRGQ